MVEAAFVLLICGHLVCSTHLPYVVAAEELHQAVAQAFLVSAFSVLSQILVKCSKHLSGNVKSQ